MLAAGWAFVGRILAAAPCGGGSAVAAALLSLRCGILSQTRCSRPGVRVTHAAAAGCTSAFWSALSLRFLGGWLSGAGGPLGFGLAHLVLDTGTGGHTA